MRRIPIEQAFFKGAVSVESKDGGMKPWRIPYEQLALFPPNGLGGHAAAAAGVRLAFLSDTRTVHVHFAPSEQPLVLDCVIADKLIATVTVPAGDKSAVFADLPAGGKEIQIYLPQRSPILVYRLEIEEGASFSEAAPSSRPKWVTYGSSITQCSMAASPAQTWPALVARERGWDLTCLGYNGNCHLEPMVARLIRDQEADFISLCLGINVMGQQSLNIRTFRASVIGLVSIIREKHPTIPIAVISPIYSPDREQQELAVGLNLVQMRSELVEAVEALRSCGDRNLHYVNGLEVLGEAGLPYMPDRLHPNAEGYRIMARGMLEQFARLPV
ncbi:SGNH/GDSL hydrolase family protein [Paenibacillus koleovorans]|uniref:SGNH/GDSL hydrolase family protein n=1 Tax=Paenibacillus koleovorans TaxID=121608 RepID=UPI000FDAA2E9|nr:SGNH/GDSL hydrolase family protein [Paenibacillus koleovorans]